MFGFLKAYLPSWIPFFGRRIETDKKRKNTIQKSEPEDEQPYLSNLNSESLENLMKEFEEPLEE